MWLSTKHTRYLKVDPEVEKWDNPLQSTTSTWKKDEAAVLTLTYFWPARKKKRSHKSKRDTLMNEKLLFSVQLFQTSECWGLKKDLMLDSTQVLPSPHPCPDCHRTNKWNNTAKGNCRRYLKVQPRAFTLILNTKPKSHKPGLEIIQTFPTQLKRQERDYLLWTEFFLKTGLSLNPMHSFILLYLAKQALPTQPLLYWTIAKKPTNTLHINQAKLSVSKNQSKM